MMSLSSQGRSKRVTLKDVARHAGVSVMTVSNVINRWPYITEETRQKVQAAIDELGYRPNTAARSLVTGRTHTIGVVIADFMNPFFGQAVRGCEDVLYKAGYNLLLCNTNEDGERERAYLGMLVERDVDGLLMFGSTSTDKEIVQIVPETLPIVAESSPLLHGNAVVIDLNSEMGAYQATQHLIGLGHRRIGHLAGPQSRPVGRQRLLGYQRALCEAGIDLDPGLVINTNPTIRSGYRAAMQLFSTQRLTALFCFNDLMAFGAMVACAHLDIDIPGELALIGFDDIPMAAFANPALTTMRIDQYSLGCLASQILLERLKSGETDWKQVSVSAELVVRNSCGAQRLSRKQLQEMIENMAVSDGVDLHPSSAGPPIVKHSGDPVAKEKGGKRNRGT